MTTHVDLDRAGAREGAPLVVLEGPELALRSTLDATFAGWGVDVSAVPTAYPPLVSVQALRSIDYWDNFPHLALLAAAPAEDGYRDLPSATEGGSVPAGLLADAQYALPSAACYSAYLNLRGAVVPEAHKITTVATCFRRESHFEGLRRLLSFTMREVVCVGTRTAAIEHLDTFTERLLAFAGRLGLPLEIENATDPFFDPNASRSVVAALFPVKREFVFRTPEHADGLAIGSVNFHRNFFAERCGITTEDGELAFTSCAAFGLERWISALTAQFGTDLVELADRVRAAA